MSHRGPAIVTVTEIKSVIEPYGITNDIRWESVTLISIHPEIILYRELTCQYPSLILSTESTASGSFDYEHIAGLHFSAIGARKILDRTIPVPPEYPIVLIFLTIFGNG